MSSFDFAKLTRDVREAVAVAELVDVPDKGSCNNDRAALAAPKGLRTASVLNAIRGAGVHAYVTKTRIRGRLFHIDIGGGQGDRRSARAQALVKELQARGWNAQMWWELD